MRRRALVVERALSMPFFQFQVVEVLFCTLVVQIKMSNLLAVSKPVNVHITRSGHDPPPTVSAAARKNPGNKTTKHQAEQYDKCQFETVHLPYLLLVVERTSSAPSGDHPHFQLDFTA
jgi:hypothetical protein